MSSCPTSARCPRPSHIATYRFCLPEGSVPSAKTEMGSSECVGARTRHRTGRKLNSIKKGSTKAMYGIPFTSPSTFERRTPDSEQTATPRIKASRNVRSVRLGIVVLTPATLLRMVTGHRSRPYQLLAQAHWRPPYFLLCTHLSQYPCVEAPTKNFEI